MNCAGFKTKTKKQNKKKGKHKSKDMNKARESPGLHWVRGLGGVEMVQTREVYTANGLYYR